MAPLMIGVAVFLGVKRRWSVLTVWVVAVAYVVAMAWGRLYVRTHWLSDVTAGVAIGTAVVLTAAIVLAWLDGRSTSRSSVEEPQS